MLQFMRQAAGSWVVKILFILLILSFGAWGVTGVYNQSGRDNTVAEVGRVKIGANQLDQEFRRQINRMRQVFGPQFDAEQAKQFGLVNQSLRQLIDRTVYDLAARDLGLVVSDRLVLQEIQREPAFRNQQGQFEPERFRSVLATNGLTEQGYADLVKRELARGELLGALGAGVQAPAPIVDDLYRRQAEKRVAETLTVPNASITDIPTPDDQTLKAYQADKADRFSAPE
jgi:peptidyl-prolyl cis-trans isomerase D